MQFFSVVLVWFGFCSWVNCKLPMCSRILTKVFPFLDSWIIDEFLWVGPEQGISYSAILLKLLQMPFVIVNTSLTFLIRDLREGWVICFWPQSILCYLHSLGRPGFLWFNAIDIRCHSVCCRQSPCALHSFSIHIIPVALPTPNYDNFKEI